MYLKDIDSMRVRYEVRDAEHNRSLVFPDWVARRRTTALVYQKGRSASFAARGRRGVLGVARDNEHFGRSVTTDDFQRAMEQTSKQNLESFFARWVYEALSRLKVTISREVHRSNRSSERQRESASARLGELPARLVDTGGTSSDSVEARLFDV
jgi:hypothetical protein